MNSEKLSISCSATLPFAGGAPALQWEQVAAFSEVFSHTGFLCQSDVLERVGGDRLATLRAQGHSRHFSPHFVLQKPHWRARSPGPHTRRGNQATAGAAKISSGAYTLRV